MKSVWRIAIALVLVVSLLSCPALAKVKLTYWQGWLATEHVEVEKEIIADFMKANPDIEIEFLVMTNPGEQLKVALAAGVLPDMMVSSRDDFPEWAQLGMFKDLTPYLARDTKFQGEFVPQLMELFKVNGRQLGLPYSANGRGLFAYDAGRLAQAGVPEPGTEPWSWDQFVSNGKKLVRFDGDKMTQSAFNVDRTPMSVWTWFWANDTDIFNANYTKSTVREQKVLDTLTYMRNLVFEYNISPRPDQLPVTACIGSGYGPWAFVPWQNEFQNGGPERKLMWQPYNGSKKRIAMLGGSGLQIGSQTKYPEETWRLLKYLTSEEVQWKRFMKGYGTSSLTKNLARASRLTDSPIPDPKSIYWDSFSVGITQPSFPKYRAWASIWNGYTAKLLAGEISVNEAAERIASETDILLKQ